MTKRPKAVTVFGSITLAVGILGIFLLILGIDQWGETWSREVFGISGSVQGTVGLLFSLLEVLCGIGILKGQNWARFLLWAYCCVRIASPLFLDLIHPSLGVHLTLNPTVTMIFGWVLFSPNAKRYFRGDKHLNAQGAA